MKQFNEDINHWKNYDFVVINDDLNLCYKQIYDFINAKLNNLTKQYNQEIIKKHNPQAIFNIAAETHVDRSIDSPSPFIQSNIISVFNLLEVMRKDVKRNIKLIHISTDEVFGDIHSKRSDENFPYQPS